MGAWAQEMGRAGAGRVSLVEGLLRTGAYVEPELEETLAEFGLTRPSFQVLVALLRTDEGKLTQSELSRAVRRTSGTISVRLARLESSGLVTREQDADDRRGVVVTLTDEGRKRVESALPAYAEACERLAFGINEGDAGDFVRRLGDWLGFFETAGEEPGPRLGIAVAPPYLAQRMRRAVGLPDRVGVLVRGVVGGSAADEAGIARGDLITAAAGEEVRTIGDLQRALASATDAGSIKLEIVRGVDERSVEVPLDGERRVSRGNARSPGCGDHLTEIPREENAMCRWMAWYGQPVLIEELLFKTQHGLVDQSLHSRMGAETTNGDGVGMGWYGDGEGPAVYHSVAPAWGDANLRELAAHIESPLFLSHIRAAIGSPVQQTNCHPFRHGRWLFVHNGFIAEFARAAARPDARDRPRPVRQRPRLDRHRGDLPPRAQLGLKEDPIGALERAVGIIESTATRHGVENAMQGSFGVSDGEQPVGSALLDRGSVADAVRIGRRRRHLKACIPENPASRSWHDDRLIVSEPFADLPGAWHEIPEATAVTVSRGGVLERQPFRPRVEGTAPAGR